MLPVETYKELDETDSMDPALRACVHDFGSKIVNGFLQQGVTRPMAIRQLVNSCWIGAREPHQRTGRLRGDNQKVRSPVAETLDWLLEQKGAQITAAQLLRFMWINGLAIIPREPSSVMVEASMATVSNHDVHVTKYEKHRLRLSAAVNAQARRLWPQIFDGAEE